ncbi:MAG: response regulator, partial [Candidatus Atribacteria bacterium]|nr:response regulator [Candidatus Atribacteria bacterium]
TQQASNNIHLVITDVVMPDMSGPTLVDKLRLLFPDIKVIFTSGYTVNVISHQGVLDKGVHFIQKPFSSKDLLLEIRKVLD